MAVVFSENPERDLWEELLQFSYKANIKRYFTKNNLQDDEKTIDSIVGSFLQSYEYFNAARNASIQIAPLLLYYGSTNLLNGMSNLISGSRCVIENHGMKLVLPEQMPFIADAEIKFLSPENGGVHVFARQFGVNINLTQYGQWKLRDFLDSIAEINSDYIQCYDAQVGRIIMLDAFSTPDGKAEKIYYEEQNREEIWNLLMDVDGFEKNYLKPTVAKEFQTGKEYFVLYRKMNGKDISERSFSGQPFLRAGHRKNNALVTIPTLLNMYVSLYALASLCRYYPERWSPFVLNDETGERLLIEKLLFFSRRMIPNFVLNRIVGDQVLYTNSRYVEKSTIKHVGEHQIQEEVDRRLNEFMGKQQLSQIVNKSH